MKISEVLLIAVHIVEKFEDNGLITPDGQFGKSVPPLVIAKVAAEVVQVLKDHSVVIPNDVDKIVGALPLILPLLIK